MNEMKVTNYLVCLVWSLLLTCDDLAAICSINEGSNLIGSKLVANELEDILGLVKLYHYFLTDLSLTDILLILKGLCFLCDVGLFTQVVKNVYKLV